MKRETVWDGYKVHFTETCEPDAIHLITNVTSTVATVSDDRMAAVVHTSLAERGLLPDEHWVDTGYANAGALVAAHRDHQLELHGPMRPVTVAQSPGDGAHGQNAFAIDWDNQYVTCPNGATSTQWNQRRSEEGPAVIRVRFSPVDCRPCPSLRDCVNPPAAERREITLRPREEHQALQRARQLQQTNEWKDRYKIRAGSRGPSPRPSTSAACAGPATAAWRKPACNTS